MQRPKNETQSCWPRAERAVSATHGSVAGDDVWFPFPVRHGGRGVWCRVCRSPLLSELYPSVSEKDLSVHHSGVATALDHGGNDDDGVGRMGRPLPRSTSSAALRGPSHAAAAPKPTAGAAPMPSSIGFSVGRKDPRKALEEIRCVCVWGGGGVKMLTSCCTCTAAP